MADDNLDTLDTLHVGLVPYAPPVHPCGACGYETKAVGGAPDDDRRVCSRPSCRTERGTIVVLLDGVGQVVPWRSRPRSVSDVRVLLHLSPTTQLSVVVRDPAGSPPLSPRAAARVAAMLLNGNQQEEGPPAYPCPECGQETKAGAIPGERACVSRLCRRTFGTMRVPLDPEDVSDFQMEPGMRFETVSP